MAADLTLPIRGFELGKSRLGRDLPPDRRRRLVRGLVEHTVSAVVEAGARPVVVTGDVAVATWCDSRSVAMVWEPQPGLDAAATAGIATAVADGQPWLVLLADLPLVSAADLGAVLTPLVTGRFVLAPSFDGGTNALGGWGPFPFSYGPGSFHRHLAAARRRAPSIVVRTGLVFDVDEPSGLEQAAARPEGAWLRSLLDP